MIECKATRYTSSNANSCKKEVDSLLNLELLQLC